MTHIETQLPKQDTDRVGRVRDKRSSRSPMKIRDTRGDCARAACRHPPSLNRLLTLLLLLLTDNMKL